MLSHQITLIGFSFVMASACLSFVSVSLQMLVFFSGTLRCWECNCCISTSRKILLEWDLWSYYLSVIIYLFLPREKTWKEEMKPVNMLSVFMWADSPILFVYKLKLELWSLCGILFTRSLSLCVVLLSAISSYVYGKACVRHYTAMHLQSCSSSLFMNSLMDDNEFMFLIF